MTSGIIETIIVCSTLLLIVLIVTIGVWTNENVHMIKDYLNRRNELIRIVNGLDGNDQPRQTAAEVTGRWTDDR
jgi:hypothetical protein